MPPHPAGSVAPVHPLREALAAALMGMLIAAGLWYGGALLRGSPVESLVFEGRPPAPGTGHWTVALVFGERDCPSLMAVVEQLNAVEDSRIIVQGLLAVDTRRLPGWRDLVRANEVRFPVRPVAPADAGRALGRLGGVPGPVLLAFDPERRLRLVAGAMQEQLTAAMLETVTRLARAEPSVREEATP